MVYDDFMLIDAHSHINFLPFQQATQVIHSCKNVSGWILGGYNPKEWMSQKALKKEFPDKVWTSAGLHPWVVGRLADDELYEALEQLQFFSGHVDFIGETGLDKNFDNPENKQEESFKKHIAIALNYKKPLLLHIVGRHRDALDILNAEKDLVQRSVNGLIHGFSGSWEVAQHYIQLGFYISIGPGVLKKNFKKLRDTVKKIPLESLVMESDSPSDFSQKRYLGDNVLPEIISYLSEARQLSAEKIKNQMVENIKTLLTPIEGQNVR